MEVWDMALVTEELKKQYDEQGYIIYENLFSADEMDRIRVIIDE
jgi:hypothetical protein